MKTHILVTDDEPLVRKSLKEILRYEGYNVTTAEDGEKALKVLEEYPVDIIMADIKMPNVGGIELLKKVRDRYPKTHIILMSAYANVENAVEAMRLGATDYITKPLDDEQVKNLIEKVKGTSTQAKAENNGGFLEQTMRLKDGERLRFHTVVGKDEKMQKIYSMIEAIADSPSTVLICGESGTGKRMIAQAIHQADAYRRNKPFIEISCGALPETLLESELFGHVKGAFTGAIKDRAGRFELADGGTLLLDEIDTCSPNLQVKLLRVLEIGEYERVGDTQTLKSDVRIIAATNQQLEELVKRRSFRGDLYWRINVISIDLPALRERTGDISLLVNHFLDKYNLMRKPRNGMYIENISEEALKAMMRYPWPGNIRELENTIERACILVRNNVIQLSDLPDSIQNYKQELEKEEIKKSDFSLKDALKHPERDILISALEHTNWNCTRTAAYLGINRTTLYNKMKQYGIKRGQRG
ncbi:MAG: sigma-54-dependent Fis family transcriptional regulator [Candidatus Omnitrophica bacterium]|nr:sigma-54-dependent Fis family transcriptional regulator [Candidatus Omnitrophota bacterium]